MIVTRRHVHATQEKAAVLKEPATSQQHSHQLGHYTTLRRFGALAISTAVAGVVIGRSLRPDHRREIER